MAVDERMGSMKCECNNRKDFFWDYYNGEIVCRSCGLVLQERISKWNAKFDEEEDTDQLLCL